MPRKYVYIIVKATDPDPEKRYRGASEMRKEVLMWENSDVLEEGNVLLKEKVSLGTVKKRQDTTYQLQQKKRIAKAAREVAVYSLIAIAIFALLLFLK